MLHEALIRTFGSVPRAFADELTFALVRDGEYYPFGDERLSLDGSELDAWTGRSKGPAHERLRVFLAGGDGYLYALWRIDDRPWATCPVVYLDDENADNSVVAGDLDEFLRLAATGAPRVAPTWLEPDVPDPFFAAVGITAPADPAAVMRAAIEAFPPFDRWLEAAMEGRDLLTEPPPVVGEAYLGLDPVPLLGGPADAPAVANLTGTYIAVAREHGRLQTVWLRPGSASELLRPYGRLQLGRTRAEIRAQEGDPSRHSDVDPCWDRYNRGDVALHVQYADGIACLVTLMWVPGLPAKLR
jgi:hypothetical protein